MKRKNGQGYVVKLDDGKYRLRKQVGVLANGNPRILTVTATSETACLKKMRRKEDEIKESLNEIDGDSAKKITLEELCMKHYKYKMSKKDMLKSKSADRNISTIRNQIANYPVGHMQAIGVTPYDIEEHIERLIDEDRLSVSSIIKALDVINAAYKWAVAKRFLTINPCYEVLDDLKIRLRNLENKNSSDGFVVVLSLEQQNQVKRYSEQIKEIAESYQYIFAQSVIILINTGMRVGELSALRWRDWDAETNTLVIEKTRFVTGHGMVGDGYSPEEGIVKNCHCRTIQLNDTASEALKEINRVTSKREPEDYIVVNRNDNPTNPSNYGANIKRLYQKLGFSDEISGAHVLRRTCATNMYNAGCNIEDIAAYLGDTPDVIRNHYVSLTKKIIANAKILNVVQFPHKK